MINLESFREHNTKFPSQKHDERKLKGSDPFYSLSIYATSADDIDAGLDPKNLVEDDLVICSHLVYGFIMDNKLWGKPLIQKLFSKMNNLYSCIRNYQH
jgi:hypothetical protein